MKKLRLLLLAVIILMIGGTLMVKYNNNINVLDPPGELSPLINDGKTDNSILLLKILEYVEGGSKEATIYFPNEGSYFFDKQIYIDMEDISITLAGSNTKINVKKANSYKNLFYIVNIDNFNVQGINLDTPNVSSGTYGNRGYIEVENANKITLNDVALDNANCGLKINFKNTDKVSEQNTVKHLITDNVSGNNVKCFMHICNIEQWEAENLKVKVTNEDLSNVPNVCFYLRPRSNNITINNLQVDNCPGDVFHFNRYDYTTVGAYPPMGTDGFEDNNIKVTKVVAKNIGQLVGFNSETNDITFKDVNIQNQKYGERGVINAFEGKCNKLTINNFIFKDINKVLDLEKNNKGINSISLKDGTITGAFKGSQGTYGGVKNLNIENIIYDNTENPNGNGALALMLYGEWDNVNMSNIKFNIGAKFKRNADVIRFGDNFKGTVIAKNITFNRPIKNKYSLNGFSVYFSDLNPPDPSTLITASDIKAINLDNIYYGDPKYFNYIK